MKGNIEDIIGSNRHVFDDMEPASGHEERFSERLFAEGLEARPVKVPRAKKQGSLGRLIVFCASAAAVLALFLLIKLTDKEVMSEQVKEVAEYYLQKLNHEADDIKVCLSILDRHSQDELLQDIALLTKLYTEDPAFLELNEEEQITYIHRVFLGNYESLGHIRSILSDAGCGREEELY